MLSMRQPSWELADEGIETQAEHLEFVARVRRKLSGNPARVLDGGTLKLAADFRKFQSKRTK